MSFQLKSPTTIGVPILFLVMLSFGSSALACQVPVFRYAIERWAPDRYEIVVLHDSPLDQYQSDLVEKLAVSTQSPRSLSNLRVRTMSVAEIQDEELTAAWDRSGDHGQPLITLRYPETAEEVPDRLVGTMPLNRESIERIVDSPLRTEIANRLVDGQSAVWIFVPIGDPEKDGKALQTLRRELERNQQSLKLPEQEEPETEAELLERSKIELRLEFSIVTLHRKSPEEQVLLDLLLESEPDLRNLKEPMAFPVLGRGRVLYALVGAGISEFTVAEACRFIIGPCSCQVKNQNPGFDLLMHEAWDKRIGSARLSDPLPEVSSEPVLLTIPPGR